MSLLPDDPGSLPYLQYDPLKSDRSIRVLVLSPSAERNDSIQCRLREICLETSPHDTVPYEALSYVWGGRHGEHPIQCDEHRVDVTKNCLEALRHLRYTDKERVLWIDAICINQSSIAEKNVQVALMGDVYKLADRTIIWLGVDETPGKAITAFFRRCRWIGLLFRAWPDAKRSMPRFPSKDVLQGLKLLMEVPWFTRAWTLQELCLSEHVIVALGTFVLPWESIKACLDQWVVLASRKFGHRTANLDIVSVMDSFGIKQNYDLAIAKDHQGGSEDERLVSTFLITRMTVTIKQRNAMDKRDHVFSVNNLLERLHVKLPSPDYGKSATTVYEELAMAFCLHSGSFWVLHLTSTEVRMDGLPSWVPDFSQGGMQLGRDQWHLLTNTPWIIPAEVAAMKNLQQSRKAGQLLIRAQKLAPVSMISGVRVPHARMTSSTEAYSEDLMTSVLPAMARWFLFAESLEFFPSRRRGAEALLGLILGLAHKNGERDEFRLRLKPTKEWWEGFYRGLMMGFTPGGQRSTEAHLKAASRRGRATNKNRNGADAQSIGWSMMNSSMEHVDTTTSVLLVCQGLTLFLAGKGILGVCDGEVRPGDIPVVGAGLMEDLVLRPRGEHFEVVGTARVLTFEQKEAQEPFSGLDDHRLETLTLV